MRLRSRRARIWNASYLTYRYLWPNVTAAVGLARSQLPQHATVLDVGCGNKPYADLFEGCLYVGANYTADDARPDVIADGMRLPIASHCIDLVFCSQVLEHVPRPWKLMEECRRVLKPGGWMVLSAPFYWPLHEEPHDYFRFTRHGLRELLNDAGFAVQTLVADGGDNARFWLSAIHAAPPWLRRFVQVPFNILGHVFDGSSDDARFPANYTVLARSRPDSHESSQ